MLRIVVIATRAQAVGSNPDPRDGAARLDRRAGKWRLAMPEGTLCA